MRTIYLSLSTLPISSLYPPPPPGWWYVEDHRGRSGWVPASYLHPLLDKERPCVTNGEKIIGTVYNVLQNHTATQADELNVKKGDMVEVVMVSVDGWWAVRWDSERIHYHQHMVRYHQCNTISLCIVADNFVFCFADASISFLVSVVWIIKLHRDIFLSGLLFRWAILVSFSAHSHTCVLLTPAL